MPRTVKWFPLPTENPFDTCVRCVKRDEDHTPVLTLWKPGMFDYERLPVCRPCVAEIRKDDALRAWEDWDDEEIEREFGEWPTKGSDSCPNL